MPDNRDWVVLDSSGEGLGDFLQSCCACKSIVPKAKAAFRWPILTVPSNSLEFSGMFCTCCL